MLRWIFEQRAIHLLTRNRKKQVYRRFEDVPEAAIRTFKDVLRMGAPPSVAYVSAVAAAQCEGCSLPSLRTFLRRINGIPAEKSAS